MSNYRARKKRTVRHSQIKVLTAFETENRVYETKQNKTVLYTQNVSKLRDVFSDTIKTVRYLQRVSKLKDVFSHTIKPVRYTQNVSKLRDVFSHKIKTVRYAQRDSK